MAKRGAKPEEQKEEIVQFVYDALVAGDMKNTIKRKCREAYDLAPRTVENYLTRAKRMLAKEAIGLTKEELTILQVQRILGVHARCAAGGPVAESVAMRALAEINDMFGLKAPAKVEQSGELKHDHGTVAITVLRQELMNDENYITYLREKSLRADSHASTLCSEGEPGPMETETPSPTP